MPGYWLNTFLHFLPVRASQRVGTFKSPGFRWHRPCVESLEGRLVPAAWTGLGGNNLWSNAANWTGNDLPNGIGDTAEFANVDVGAVEVDGTFTIDSLTFSNSTGSWSLNFVAGGSLTIANGGTLNQSGVGTNQIAAQLNAVGLIATISAGSLELSNTADPAVLASNSINGTSVFHIQGGRLIASAENVSGSQRNPLGTATVQFDTAPGGIFQVRAKAIASHIEFFNPIVVQQSGTIEQSGSDLNVDFDLDSNILIAANRTLTFNATSTQAELHVHAVISGDGNIVKTGPGTLHLDRANTYTGTTTIQQGTINAVGINPLGTAANGTRVEAGATLNLLTTPTAETSDAITLSGMLTGRPGTVTRIGSLTSFGGHVNPAGTSTATLTVNGNLSLDDDSTLTVDLQGNTPNTDYDQLNVIGTVALAGTLSIRMTASVPAGPFTIIDNDGADAVVGTFEGLAEGSVFTVGEDTFRITYVGGTGNDVVLTTLSAEPLVLRGVQRGSVSMGSDTTQVVVLATAVDPTRAFVIASFRNNNSSPDLLPTVEITDNGTRLSITRSPTTSEEVVEWQVVEFISGVRVQRGVTTLSAAELNADVALGQVNLSKTYVLTSVRSDIDADIDRINDERWTVMARLTDDDQLSLSRFEADTPVTVAWQVIEFTAPNISVQSGVTTLSGSSVSQAIANRPGPEFLIFSSRTQPSTEGPGVESNYATRGRITAPTRLTFDRFADSDNSVELSWFVISMPGAVVQSGDVALTNGALPPPNQSLAIDIDIDSVDLDRSFSLFSTRLMEAGDDRKLDEASLTGTLLDVDQLRFQRLGGATVVGAETSWFVVELPDDTIVPTVISIERTGDESTTADIVRYEVTFSEDVLGLDLNDFQLTTTGEITDVVLLEVTGGGSVYFVTVSTGAGNGTLGLRMAGAPSIADLVGNQVAPSSAAAVYIIDRTFPVQQVDEPTSPPPVEPPAENGNETGSGTLPPQDSGASDGESPSDTEESSTGSGGSEPMPEPVGENAPEAVPEPTEAIPIKPRIEPGTEPRGATTTPVKPANPAGQRTTAQAVPRVDFSFLRQELDDPGSGGGGGMNAPHGVTEVATGVTGAALVLTVGYIALFGRNAILVWTVMINLPMWRELDPLAVLEFWEKKGRGARAEQEVGELFDA